MMQEKEVEPSRTCWVRQPNTTEENTYYIAQASHLFSHGPAGTAAGHQTSLRLKGHQGISQKAVISGRLHSKWLWFIGMQHHCYLSDRSWKPEGQLAAMRQQTAAAAA